MNKKKKHKDWNETSYVLHLFFFEGPHYLCSSSKRSWSKKMRSACDMHGKEQKCIMSLVWVPEGQGPLWRLRRRWEDIIMDPIEIWYEGLAWVHLAQDRENWWALVNIVMNVQVSQKLGKLLISWTTFNFSSAIMLQEQNCMWLHLQMDGIVASVFNTCYVQYLSSHMWILS